MENGKWKMKNEGGFARTHYNGAKATNLNFQFSTFNSLPLCKFFVKLHAIHLLQFLPENDIMSIYGGRIPIFPPYVAFANEKLKM